jgi:hypothetical protein
VRIGRWGFPTGSHTAKRLHMIIYTTGETDMSEKKLYGDKVALRLFHGRAFPSEELVDWGADGPIFILDGVQYTYGEHSLILESDSIGELHQYQNLVYYDGMYYGDFCVFNPDEAYPRNRQSIVEHFGVTEFSKDLAKVPGLGDDLMDVVARMAAKMRVWTPEHDDPEETFLDRMMVGITEMIGIIYSPGHQGITVRRINDETTDIGKCVTIKCGITSRCQAFGFIKDSKRVSTNHHQENLEHVPGL